MLFDPTISAGTIIAILSICLTVLSTGIGIYLKFEKHMTKHEAVLEALVKEVSELKQRQNKIEEVNKTLAEKLAELVGEIKGWGRRREREA